MPPKSALLKDTLALIFSVLVISASVVWLFSNGVFAISLMADETLSWHLVRSAGMTAYILLASATVWGLLVTTGQIRNWSPGALSTTLHNTLSSMALVFGFVHAILLLWDKYYTYTLTDILVPFTGPYRPEAVGLGTLAFWLIVALAVSFPLKRYMGHKNWKLLHYTSYLTFALVTVHSLFAGTDSHMIGFRVVVATSVVAVTTLLGIKLARSNSKHQRNEETPLKAVRIRAGEATLQQKSR